jgi:hypothetical protein
MVLQQGLRLTLAGTAVGLMCALIAARLMSRLLYGMRPADPLTFVGVAVLACYIPARHATKVDPMIALRCE